MWTRRLVKNINVWIQKKHGEVDYWVAQFLTGHRSFGSYLKKIKKRADDRCFACKVRDDPEHAIFYCMRWEPNREEATGALGKELNPDNIVDIMTESEDNWNTIHKMIRNILYIKERED